MAAFPTGSRDAFMMHWERILYDETVTTKAVLVDGKVAGSVVSFEQDGKPEVGYWREGILGQGLRHRSAVRFSGAREDASPVRLRRQAQRRLHPVLEKCGVEISGEENGPSDVPGEEAEGLILALRAESGQAR